MSSKRGQKPEDRLWYVHAPGKSEKRAAVDVAPPSNIPYLNGVMDTDEEINKRSEIYFKPTDSDFVKLSKMGGREDLLIHKAKMGSKEPVGYAQTPWWADMLQETEASKKASDAKSYVSLFFLQVSYIHIYCLIHERCLIAGSIRLRREYVFTVPAWFAHQEQQQQQATAPVRTEQTGGYQMATNPYAYTGENR